MPVAYFTKKVDRRPVSKNVFISLTTIPSRIDGIKPTINSLLDQSIRPSNILINIPGDEQTIEVPEQIKKCQLITINWVKHDLGPATKLLPTLEIVEDNDLVIVLDDDQVYPKKMVETYLHHSEKYPEAALCQVGWKVPESDNHEDRISVFGAKFRIVGQENPVREPVQVDVLQGASSYAVKRKLFTQEVTDYNNAPDEARFVDDIWFSGHLAKNKVNVYVVPGFFKYCRLSNWKVASGTGLVKTANKNHHNNNVLYEYFKSYWNRPDQ